MMATLIRGDKLAVARPLTTGANLAARRDIQIQAQKDWSEKGRHRLAWDPKKHRLAFKPGPD